MQLYLLEMNPPQPPSQPHVAFCIIGQVRAARIGAASLLEWLHQLSRHYQVHLFLAVSRDLSIADWKINAEAQFLQNMYAHPKVAMGDAEWEQWKNDLRAAVHKFTEIAPATALLTQPFPEKDFHSVHHRLLYTKAQLMQLVLEYEAAHTISFSACIITRPDVVYTAKNQQELTQQVGQLTFTTSSHHQPRLQYAYQWDMFYILSRPLIARFAAALPQMISPKVFMDSVNEYIRQLEEQKPPHYRPSPMHQQQQSLRAFYSCIAMHTLHDYFFGKDAHCNVFNFGIVCLCRNHSACVQEFEKYLASFSS